MKSFFKDHIRLLLLVRIVSLSLMWSTTVHGELPNSPSSCDELLNDCEYYACLEASYGCGKLGYPVGFGKKYCLRFEEKKEKFSEAGKLWSAKTRLCLMTQLGELNSNSSCRELKKTAFKHHIPCYVDSGYCELPKSDQRILLGIVSPSLWRMKVLLAGIKVKSICKKRKKSSSSHRK